MKDLRLKQRWKGFLKRSAFYKLAVLYAIIGLLFFLLGAYVVCEMASRFNTDPASFILETPEQLRAVGFLSLVSVLCFFAFIPALMCWIGMLALLCQDYNHRLKRIEGFLEEDGVFHFRKDED